MTIIMYNLDFVQYLNIQLKYLTFPRCYPQFYHPKSQIFYKQLYNIYIEAQLFSDGTVDFLSDPSSGTYIPAYGGFIKFELIMSIMLVVAAGYLVHLFFKKNSRFPKYYVVFLIASAVYVSLDYGMLSLMTVPAEAKKIIEIENS